MAHTPATTNSLHGVMAEFDSGQALVEAARKTMAQGFTRVEAYSPVPIEELNDIIHKKRTVLPKLVLCGGLTGMATGFTLQYWASVLEYPMNIGGRPLHSWPSFIPVAFETTILGAALFADPCITRGPLASARLTPAHPLHRHACAATGQDLPTLWARRSLFARHGRPQSSCANRPGNAASRNRPYPSDHSTSVKPN